MKKQLFLGLVGTCMAGMAMSSASAATVINDVTQTAGEIESITIDSVVTPVGDLIPVSGLTKVNIINYLVGDGDSVPTAGSRSSAIFDNSLVTGLANVLGADADALRITFAAPIYNGPGGDIILFDLGTTTGGNATEAWRVATKAGVIANDPAQYVEYLVGASYISSATINLDMYGSTTTLNSVAALESESTTFTLANGNVNNFHFTAVMVDLTDLGYANGESITELRLGANGISSSRPDLLAAYGVVPEPASVGLIGLGSLMFIGRRRSRA